MTPQEQQLLQGLTDRVNQTQLTDKDPEAEQFIFQALGRNTDSLYILSQTVLVQQYALDQAKKQLDDAKQQLAQAQQAAQQPVKHTSFLGSLLGTDEPSRPAPPPPPPPPYAPVQTYAPPVAYAQPVAYGAPQYGGGFGAPSMGGQSGGFLRSAMTTATGVAAGALAFEGIESLMHGFDQHAGYGAGSFEGMGGGPREEVVNNYYGDSSPNDKGDLSDRFAAAGDQPSSDIEDRRGFADETNDQADVGTDDTTDNFTDDSSDDDSSFDSGGGDDNNY